MYAFDHYVQNIMEISHLREITSFNELILLDFRYIHTRAQNKDYGVLPQNDASHRKTLLAQKANFVSQNL